MSLLIYVSIVCLYVLPMYTHLLMHGCACVVLWIEDSLMHAR